MYTTKTIQKNSYGEDREVIIPNYKKIITHSIIVLIALIVIFGSVGTINAGERGVKLRLGNVVGTVEAGLYFKLPLIEKVETITVRTQSVVYERENPLSSASADLQDVQIASVTNYHVNPALVTDLYKQYRTLDNHEEQVIRPAVRDTVKAIASQFTASDLVTKRAEFAEKVASKLNERLGDAFIIVEQSNITDIQFSPSFTQAIEAKVTAVQNAEAAKNKLAQVEYEKAQRIAQAQGEAEAIRIQAQAINSQGGEDYVKLKSIEKWNGAGCTSYCGMDASSGLLINAK